MPPELATSPNPSFPRQSNFPFYALTGCFAAGGPCAAAAWVCMISPFFFSIFSWVSLICFSNRDLCPTWIS